jgi:predicted metal-dependent hydrolase
MSTADPADPTQPSPIVEVRRSARRRRTVSAYRQGDRVIVLVPASLTRAEERQWVSTMLARLERRAQRKAERGNQRSKRSDADLLRRAGELSTEFLDGRAVPDSVRWVTNQNSRWGSCTPSDRSIRLSDRLRPMPTWVQDYVLVHELAHLLVPGHDAAFWAWVDRYPRAERAKGFLSGWVHANQDSP